jgi:hypothetical protein
MLKLPQVTLCCVDTRLPALALKAMQASMAHVQFAEALLFTSPLHGLTHVPDTVKVIELNTIRSIEDYSHFLLKGMRPYLRTSHMLIVQWDGYVVDPSMWRPEFLAMDYIGAVWPQFDDNHRVGNGGFSLRSAKLLHALEQDEIRAQHPEDICIARTNRTMLENGWGIKFADEALAHQFASERERATRASFGFHGVSNFVNVLPNEALLEFVDAAPAELFTNVEARNLIKRLIAKNLKTAALIALKKRASLKSIDLADIRLWLRYLF